MTKQYDNAPWDQAIEKLIRLTEEGRLRWQETTVPLRPLMQDFVGPVYATGVEGRRIAVYEYSFPAENDEFGKFLDRSVRVEFVDQDGQLIWTWPVSRGRSQLLDAVRYQAVNGDSFLGSFLEQAAMP